MKKNLILQLFLIKGSVYVTDNEIGVPIDDVLDSTIQSFGDLNADGIIVRSEGKTDQEKETDLKLLKKITKKSEIPVTAAFVIDREEDVKKVLYADAKCAILNLSKQSNWDMLEDVSKRFGKEKIAVTFDSFSNLGVYRKMAENYASSCFVFNGEKPRNIAEEISLPLYLALPDITLDKMFEVLKLDSVGGIFGYAVNNNQLNLPSIKSLCRGMGIEVSALTPQISWDSLRKNSDGLVPVIAQDYRTGAVLMMAYMNEEAYNKTFETGKMNYYSRSRKSQWEKGEESGHFQYVKSIYADCDYDTILAKVSQIGVACHTGNPTCFFNEVAKVEYDEKNPLKVFEQVYSVIEDRKANPKEGSYTNYLFDKGIDKILKKVGEEATEIVIAAKNPEAGEIKYEISDFLYHCMVLMVEKGISWEDICNELAARE